MNLVYTHKARASLRDITYYLKKNGLDSKFIKNYINDVRTGIKKVLTVFPEAGTEQSIDGYTCRRIMVQEHSVLYRYAPEQRLIKILLIYRYNQPTLK